MKRCKEIETSLLYHIEQLEMQALPVVVREHLQTCEHCASLYQALSQVERAVWQHGEVPMPDERYFEDFPTTVLERLASQKIQPVAALPEKHEPSWLGRFFAHRFFKPAAAMAATLFIGVVIYQTLPEGAKIEAYKNRQSVGGSTGELVENDQAQTAPPAPAEPQKKAMEQPAKSEAQRADAGQIQKMTAAPSQTEQSPQEEMRTNNLAADESDETPQLTKSRQQNIRPLLNADSAFADGQAGRASELEGAAFRQSAVSAGERSRPSFYSLASEKGAVAFAVFFRRAQNTPSLETRAEIWKQFLATTKDSSQYALGLVELAKTTKNLADESTEILKLASAVAWFEEKEAMLKPLMGEQEFDKNLAELRERLQHAKKDQLP